MISNILKVTVTFISRFHLYVNLICNRESQAPICRTPFSSDNSCLTICLCKLKVKDNLDGQTIKWLLAR